VAALSTAQNGSRLIDGTAGSNPAQSTDVILLFFVMRCLSSELCKEFITHSEEFFQVTVSNCVGSRNLYNKMV